MKMKWGFSNNKSTNQCFHIKHQLLTTQDSAAKDKIININNSRFPHPTKKYLLSKIKPHISLLLIVWVRINNSADSSIRCWPSTRLRTKTIRSSQTILFWYQIARSYRTPRYSIFSHILPKSILTLSLHKMKARQMLWERTIMQYIQEYWNRSKN